MQTSFTKWSKLAGAGAVAMIALAGCAGADTTGDGQRTDSMVAQNLATGVDRAQNVTTSAAENAADVAGNAADTAGEVASNVATGAVGAGRAIVVTPNVKEAIGDRMPNTGIDVDTNGTTKVITLRGVVANPAQVKLAGDVAKKEAPGYTIVNNLRASNQTAPITGNPRTNP